MLRDSLRGNAARRGREEGRDGLPQARVRGEEREQADGRDVRRLRQPAPGRESRGPPRRSCAAPAASQAGTRRPSTAVYACDIVSRCADAVREGVFAEIDRRDPRHERQWIGLVDGNNDQIRTFKEQAAKRGMDMPLIIDFIHVLGYLWKTAWCFVPAGNIAAAEALVTDWGELILDGKSQEVAADIGHRAAADPPGPGSEHARNIRKTLAYLENKEPYLDYPTALANGWPISAGIIEGACRHLVGDRMGVTGARWSLAGAQSVLWMRAIHASGDTAALLGLPHPRQTPAQPPQQIPGPRRGPRTRRLNTSPGHQKEPKVASKLQLTLKETHPCGIAVPRRAAGRTTDPISITGPIGPAPGCSLRKSHTHVASRASRVERHPFGILICTWPVPALGLRPTATLSLRPVTATGLRPVPISARRPPSHLPPGGRRVATRRPPELVAGTRNSPGVFGCRVIVRRDWPWESPHERAVMASFPTVHAVQGGHEAVARRPEEARGGRREAAERGCACWPQ